MTAPGDTDPTELAPPDGSPPHALSGTQQNLRAGHAGFASRFISFVFDWAVSTGVFLLVLEGASFAANVLTGGSILWHRGSLWVVLAFWGWEFIYHAYFWTTSGKTPGMTLLGVRVVRHDGSDVGTRRGLVRTLVFPLSFLLLGLGFLGILFGRDRRALHDTIAGTAVIYAWDARAARLRSLAREGRGRQ
jgi:uncharacterized RDD family membrane protein YckC